MGGVVAAGVRRALEPFIERERGTWGPGHELGRMPTMAAVLWRARGAESRRGRVEWGAGRGVGWTRLRLRVCPVRAECSGRARSTRPWRIRGRPGGGGWRSRVELTGGVHLSAEERERAGPGCQREAERAKGAGRGVLRREWAAAQLGRREGGNSAGSSAAR